MKNALLLLALLAPAAAADDLVVIRAGRVITVSGEELAPGTIVVRDGKVEAVGSRVEVPGRARVLDWPDRVVMPGLVLARTRAGLPGYDRGGNQSHLSAGPELALVKDKGKALLERGVVLAGVVPLGTAIPGQAVALRPGEGQVEGGYLRVRLNDLPDEKRVLREALRAAQAAIDKEAALRADFEKKQASTAPVDTKARFEAPPVPEPLRAWVALLKKDKDAPRPLVELGSAAGWVHLEEGFEKQPLFARLLLANGPTSDLDRVVDRITAKKPLVVCAPRLSMEANTRTRRNLPAELAKGGARVALLPPGDDEEGLKGWLAAVALVQRDGLPRVEALRAITLRPAEALGLDKEVGSIEPGKRADLVVLDGDPFEVGTKPVATLLAGRVVWEAPAKDADEEEEDAWGRSIDALARCARQRLSITPTPTLPRLVPAMRLGAGVAAGGGRVSLALLAAFALAGLAPGVARAQDDDDDDVPPTRADEQPEPGKAPAPAPGSVAAVDTTKAPRWLAVKCGELFTVTQGRRRDVTVLARDGKIVAIGERVAIPAEAQVIDAHAQKVYPGLVAFETSGLVGQPPEDATDPFNLNMAVALSSGITTVGAGDAVAKLTWGTLEGHVVATGTLVKLDVSTAQARTSLRGDLLEVRERGRQRRAFEQARARGQEDAKDPGPLRGRQGDLEKITQGRARGVVAAGTRAALLAAADLATEFHLALVIVGCEEGWTVAPELGRAGASVVLVPRSRMAVDPKLAHPGGWSIENALRLHEAGVPVAVISASRAIGLGGVGGNDLNTLNLEAAFAIRGGLDEEAGLEALTIVPARLLGVDDRVGSVEVGKDCDLAVCGGDLLHYETLVEWTIVDGRVAYDRDKDTLLRHIRPRTPAGGDIPQLWPRPPGTPEPPMPEKEQQ